MQYIHYLRYIVGVFLLIAGLAKIPNISDFYTSVTRYDFFVGLFGNSLPFLVRLIILLEIIIGLLLITGHFRKTVITAASTLFLFFIGLSVYDYLAGIKQSCGCFGGFEILETSSELRIIQNFVILFMLLGFLKYDKYSSLNWNKIVWIISGLSIASLFVFYQLILEDKHGTYQHRSITDYCLPDLFTEETICTSDFNSSLLLMVFINPYDCIVCIDEAPLWNDLHYHYENVSVVGVTDVSSRKILKQFFEINNVKIPILYDPGLVHSKNIGITMNTGWRVLLNDKREVIHEGKTGLNKSSFQEYKNMLLSHLN